MKYYHLRSLLATGKQSISLKDSSDSFYVAGLQAKKYIEPTFSKVIYETERPVIILVSAVGATGKTALAEQLSRDVGLPLLDLGKHKPVGDNTLTGLLTHAFETKDIGRVFEGLASGTFGVIIDGVDEGRSKTTEKAFEAFLDDVVKLCSPNSGATVVMLGRTQIVEECWLYLSGLSIPTALITISPFTIEKAKEYIDVFTGGLIGSYAVQYAAARDAIVEKLKNAFVGDMAKEDEDFLSFIGYPPVLDAIVTLLKDEPNYHKLLEMVGNSVGGNVEVSLLHRISQYILLRERDMKVRPNILVPLLEDVPEAVRNQGLVEAFSVREQCLRLVAHCVGAQFGLAVFDEPVVNERYEAHLASWLPEHPFISGRQFRNAVFEALALATLMGSGGEMERGFVNRYFASHKSSYHLIYMLDTLSADRLVDVGFLSAIFTAAMEFSSVHSEVELRLDGPDWDEEEAEGEVEVGIEIEIVLGDQKTKSKTFEFSGIVNRLSDVYLGSRLAGTFITVPCAVTLGRSSELELIAPVEIRARSVALDAGTLIVRNMHHKGAPGSGEEGVDISCQALKSTVEKIITGDATLTIKLESSYGVSYPLVQYVQKADQPPVDPLLRQKYFRLRRILMEFRSHSKGALARYRYKIESERVLKNDVGRSVLAMLITDQILSLKGSMYYLDPSRLSEEIGVTWQDLRKGKMSNSLMNYLSTVI